MVHFSSSRRMFSTALGITEQTTGNGGLMIGEILLVVAPILAAAAAAVAAAIPVVVEVLGVRIFRNDAPLAVVFKGMHKPPFHW